VIKIKVISFVLATVLVACGGGGGDEPPATNGAPTAAQVAAITPAQLKTYSAANIQSLGENIVYLSDPALQALSFVDSANVTTGSGQVGAITAVQIALFKPSQVRMIGAAGLGGSVSTARIDQLNAAAWAQLVKDPLQVAAITPAEIKILRRGDHIVAMGGNIRSLSNAALQALTFVDGANVTTGSGQIGAITVAQIAVFTPAQVRMIGAAGLGGSVSTARIDQLNAAAWEQLVKDPLQVAAITPDEIKMLRRADHFAAMGDNFRFLTEVSLSVLTASQISLISPAQKALLTTAQHAACGC